MNCSIEIPTDGLHATAVSKTTRLDSLSLQSNHTFKTNMIVADEVTEPKMNIRIPPNLVEISRGCAVAARSGPFSESAAESLGKMQIREGTNEPAFKESFTHQPNENEEIESSLGMQSLGNRFNPLTLTMNSTNESSGIDLSQRMIKPITLTTNSPCSNHEDDGTLEDPNIEGGKGWEPDRTQRLKRKYHEWAAIEAAFRRPRSDRAHNAGRGAFIPQSNRAHPNQQPRINPDTTQWVTDMAYQVFDGLEINSPLPTFSPMPGDIICSQVCRDIQQTNPYFNPGGHCLFYFEPGQPIDRALQLSAAGRREDAGFAAEPDFQFHPYDMIVRAGKLNANYQFLPQDFVEVFRFMGSQHTPCPWILIGRTPYQPLAAPVLYATGDPQLGHRVVAQFVPEVRVFGQNLGFQPRPTDLLLTETHGFSQIEVSYYDHMRSRLETRSMILRAGYGRVEDSLLATVEMFQYLLNSQTQQMGWTFQGRDVQIFGGSQTLDSLIQAMDPSAIAGPRAPPSAEDIALADSYLNL